MAARRDRCAAEHELLDHRPVQEAIGEGGLRRARRVQSVPLIGGKLDFDRIDLVVPEIDVAADSSDGGYASWLDRGLGYLARLDGQIERGQGVRILVFHRDVVGVQEALGRRLGDRATDAGVAANRHAQQLGVEIGLDEQALGMCAYNKDRILWVQRQLGK